MDWTWTTSLDQLWRTPTFPMWLTLAAAGFFALVLLATLLRAERSAANGALTVITLLAVAVAAASTIRGFGPGAGPESLDVRAPMAVNASLPALSCIDDLAGESVETACEKVLFGSADHVAAAVSYAAAQISSLTAFGDVAAANKVMTPALQALRRAVERDRYGLIAYVLTTRDLCSPTDCPAFRSLTDHHQIVSNMEGKAYDGLVLRYAASWSGPAAAAAAAAAVPDEPRSQPTGKPTNAEFPTSASIPPVNIMTPEPATTSAAEAPAAPTPTPRPAVEAAKPSPAQHVVRPKKPAAPPKSIASPPIQLAPAAAGRDN